MNVDDLLGAIRSADTGTGDDAELAAGTRLRVLRSLEVRARSRHQLVGLATAAGVLLAGTVSWALATGHVAALWAPEPARVEPVAPPPPKPAVPRPRTASAVVPPPAAPAEPPPPASEGVAPAPAAEPVPPAPAEPPPALAEPPAGPGPPRAVQRPGRAAAPAVERLYRRAHDLHFHGSDPAAALAAWEAYLAAEPDGRFSVEARYNRALLLVRLGRYAQARAALAPFARGEVMPRGYRQGEAEQLVQRLAQYE